MPGDTLQINLTHSLGKKSKPLRKCMCGPLTERLQRLKAYNKMDKNIQEVREVTCGKTFTPMLETHPI